MAYRIRDTIPKASSLEAATRRLPWEAKNPVVIGIRPCLRGRLALASMVPNISREAGRFLGGAVVSPGDTMVYYTYNNDDLLVFSC